MDSERRSRIETLYQAALTKTPSERSPFLSAACAHDPALLREVESLINCAEAILNQPAGDLPDCERALNEAGLARTIDSGLASGLVIGPYHFLQQIGAGGMGDVWLADQRYPVRRRVAIKLIKAGMDTRDVIARFESERQALALMDHPAVAKVFDAGSTPTGRPYFVMEYVRGMPITDYCDKHRLTVRERMELFIQVCEGVRHAHQKAIIHRDLKPTNILITELDGKAVPKIIDFGVAKAISHRLTDDTLVTLVGALLGTPEYMSPEQADSVGHDVDTRTDVYSLGVVLYELLVGAVPLDLEKLTFQEMLRKLREEDAPRPSTKLRTQRELSTVTARNRHTEPSALSRQLHGDLDSIVMKALEKERAHRYGGPSEFAADIRRYLRHEPVAARHAGISYRVRKYARRHRIGVAAASGLVVLLSIFAITQARDFQRIKRERDRADRITSFMTGMFKVSTPDEARGRNITAREILDKASKGIETELPNDPELRAQMMQVMGTVYEGLGLYAQAHALLSKSLGLRQRILGPNNPDTLTSMSSLASTVYEEGQYAQAESMYREVFDIQRRTLGLKNRDTLKSLVGLSNVLDIEGHYPEAERLQREALDTARAVLGPDDPDTLRLMDSLANTVNREGHHAEAEKLEREALESVRRLRGADHPDTLAGMINLANILDEGGNYAEAEKLLEDALSLAIRVFGADHPKVQILKENLSVSLMHLGRYDDAKKLELEVLDNRRRLLGPLNALAAGSLYNLACIAAQTGQRDQALAALREAIRGGLDAAAMMSIEQDSDLNALHGDPRFAALVLEGRRRASAMAEPK